MRRNGSPSSTSSPPSATTTTTTTAWTRFTTIAEKKFVVATTFDPEVAENELDISSPPVSPAFQPLNAVVAVKTGGEHDAQATC